MTNPSLSEIIEAYAEHCDGPMRPRRIVVSVDCFAKLIHFLWTRKELTWAKSGGILFLGSTVVMDRNETGFRFEDIR